MSRLGAVPHKVIPMHVLEAGSRGQHQKFCSLGVNLVGVRGCLRLLILLANRGFDVFLAGLVDLLHPG